MFLSKSVVLPTVWFGSAMSYKVMSAKSQSKFFEQQKADTELHNKRLVVLKALMTQNKDLDNLQKLNTVLDNEMIKFKN